jgi:hypothetical protein
VQHDALLAPETASAQTGEAQEDQSAHDKVISTLRVFSGVRIRGLPICEVGVSLPVNWWHGGFMSSKQVSVIGVELDELQWVKTLIFLLRHPEPGTPELARQALLHLAKVADKRTADLCAASF